MTEEYRLRLQRADGTVEEPDQRFPDDHAASYEGWDRLFKAPQGTYTGFEVWCKGQKTGGVDIGLPGSF